MVGHGARRRVGRWAAWLGFGIVLGLGLGFVAGLTRPRAQKPRIGSD